MLNASRFPLIVALSCAVALTSAGLSQAENVKASRVEIGTLVCSSDGAIGKVLQSSQTLSCIYKPENKNSAADYYNAKIETFGLQLGMTGKTQMTWLVMAASKNAFKPGVLAGRYGGVSAGATVGVGGGINMLGVEAGRGFTLQPVSGQVQSGMNLAVGVTQLTLMEAQPAKTAPHGRKHR